MTVQRFFTQISPTPENSLSSSKPLSEYFNHNAVVVLGDPGSGKTTSFKKASTIEPNAKYERIRWFLSLPPEQFKDKTLYLDGLDEQRSKAEDGSSIIDSVMGRLAELGSPPFRLSCRSADWYGKSDEEVLKKVANGEIITVLEIDPLDESDILAIAGEGLENPEIFLKEAQQKGIQDLLINPQTLNMVLTVYKDEGGFPESLKNLYQKCCEILANEKNEEHQRAKTQLKQNEVLDLAGFLCTIQLCANIEGFSKSPIAEIDGFPFIGSLGEIEQKLPDVISRNIFCEEGAERRIPVHRTISEYLSALYLSRKIENGSPIAEVLSILTGSDGGPLSDLRGILAWIPCLCPEESASFINTDPLGIVLYGDVAELPSKLKEKIFFNIINLHDEDPLFRHDIRAAEPFGNLACKELENLFINILSSPSRDSVISTCLDVIAFGKPMVGMKNSLLMLIRDHTRKHGQRVHALRALINICSRETGVFLVLLDEIHAGQIQDDKRRLRGILLDVLYPNKLGPADVVDYFVKLPSNHVIGYEFDRFIHRKLLEKTDDKDLPALIDALCKSNFQEIEYFRYPFQTFIGDLLNTVIKNFGDNAQINRLYDWLGIGLDKYGMNNLDEKHYAYIREWMENHPEVIRDLFKHWLSITNPDSLDNEYTHFLNRLNIFGAQKGFGRFLLEMTKKETNETRSKFLFINSVKQRSWYLCDSAPTLEEFYDFVTLNPKYKYILDSELFCEIPDWRKKDSIYKKRESQVQSQDIDWLNKNIEEIRSGKNLQCLNHLVEIYFDAFDREKEELSPKDRLIKNLGLDITNAALEGFIAFLGRTDIPSPDQISKKCSEGKIFLCAHVVLAGIDLLSKKSMKSIYSLPNKTLESAIAFNFACTLNQRFDWIEEISTNEPEFVSETLFYFLERQLDNSENKFIDGLWELGNDKEMKKVAKFFLPKALSNYPHCHEEPLKNLLNAALNILDRNVLLEIISAISSRNDINKNQRVIWLGAGFILDPENYHKTLKKEVGRDKTKIVCLYTFLEPHLNKISHSPKSMSHLIEIFGAEFLPYKFGSGGGRVTVGMNISEMIMELISNISGIYGLASSQALESLKANQSLSAWHNIILHASSVHRKITRESDFQYPSVEDFVQKLQAFHDFKSYTWNDVIDLKLGYGGSTIDLKLLFKKFWNWFSK